MTSPDIIARMERTLALFVEVNQSKEPEPVEVPVKALLEFLELLGVQKAKRLAAQIHSVTVNPLKF